MSTEQTTAVLGHHLSSFSAGDVDVTMEDYYRGEHALHAEGLLKSLEAIRGIFEAFISGPFSPQHRRQLRAFATRHRVGRSPARFRYLIVRDGNITDQTFARHVIPKG